MKTGNLFCALCLAGMALAPLPAAADMTELLEMSENLDRAEKRDFQAAIEQADSCTRARDFSCAETELDKAAKLAGSGQDKKTLLASRNALANEKQAARDEQEREEQLAREEAERERQRLARLREEEESSNTAAMFMTAINVLGSAYNETMAEQARTDALERERVARLREAIDTQERQRKAEAAAQAEAKRQRQAEQDAAYARQVAGASSRSGNDQAAREAEAARQKATADALAAKKEKERNERIAQQEREARQNAQYQMRDFVASSNTANVSGYSLSDGAGVGSSGSSQKPAASGEKLLRTPEAVVVCTFPEQGTGRFRCDNPLNSMTGHLKDISGYRTPEEMVMSLDSCPSPQRLRSTTHMVWGCGFAATGANNAIDRGVGIDIDGRETYYCTPKQFSCRRTNP